MMEKLNRQKAQSKITWIVIAFILVAIVLFFETSIYTNLLGRSTNTLGSQVTSGVDCDDDGILNAKDLCPCPIASGNILGQEINPKTGCPIGYTITGSKSGLEDRKCTLKLNCAT